MSPPNDHDTGTTDPKDQGTDDSGGDVPRPPNVLAAALLGGAVGGFIGAVAGVIVSGMTG
jgi:hypothetical protein